MRTIRRGVVAVAALFVVAGCSTSAGRAEPSPSSIAARSGAASELVTKVASWGAGPRSDTPARKPVSSAEQAFGVRLVQQLSGVHDGSNLTVSPLSLAMALAMLENGARGKTLGQIASTLGTSSLSPSMQDEGLAALVSVLGQHSQQGGIALDSANSLWLQKGLAVDSQFLAAMARYFATGIWQVDFGRDPTGAAQAINQWVTGHTDGKITQLFGTGALDHTTQLVLANAVYFHATWQNQFDPNRSFPGAFDVSPGQTTRVTFMQESVPNALVTSGYDAVVLPYNGGQYQAVVIMPVDETLRAFIRGLTPADLDRIGATTGRPATVELPRFTTQSYQNLDQTLQAMGMPIAFTDVADFSTLSTEGLSAERRSTGLPQRRREGHRGSGGFGDKHDADRDCGPGQTDDHFRPPISVCYPGHNDRRPALRKPNLRPGRLKYGKG
jgi:serpin B